MVNWFQTKLFLRNLIKSRHWKGFGIHSPFAFDLVVNLMREKHQYYDFKKINNWRNALLKNKSTIIITDLGAGSAANPNNKRTVSSIARYGAIPVKYGELIYRIVTRYSCGKILELGTSLSISTLYLALPNKKAQVITIEGCPETARWARHTLEQFEASNTEILTGHFAQKLPEALSTLQNVDIVFFDGDHTEKSTLNYFHQCLNYVHNDSIFIFDDIHWSPGMDKAWQQIIDHPQVTVSIDIFRLGIVFFRKECQKEHFVVRF